MEYNLRLGRQIIWRFCVYRLIFSIGAVMRMQEAHNVGVGSITLRKSPVSLLRRFILK